MLSFVHADAGIVLHEQAHLVVRHAAFYTPFRGWHQLDRVPSSEYPPSITGVRSLGRGGTIIMDHLICKGLKYCLDNSGARVAIKNSLFLENYYGAYSYDLDPEVQRSVFFRNVHGCSLSSHEEGNGVEDSLFLQNKYALYYSFEVQVVRSTFAQNGWAMYYSGELSLNDVLLYGNDIAIDTPENIVLFNVTFLGNRLGLTVLQSFRVKVLDAINFLGPAEYHLYYYGSDYGLDVSSTYWNTSSADEIKEEIYGDVQILQAESMPHEPFHHGMYQEDVCAGQCLQHWFNSNWSSLISAGAGTFGFFDPERSLNSGQVLREALLTGHATSGLSLSSYMQDVAGLLEAVAAFQTVAVSTTSGSAVSTATTTVSTGTQTSTVSQTSPATSSSFATSSDEAHSSTTGSALAMGDGVNVTTPLTLAANTTWTAGLHTVGSTVTVLPGVTLIIQGNASIPAAAVLVKFMVLWWVWWTIWTIWTGLSHMVCQGLLVVSFYGYLVDVQTGIATTYLILRYLNVCNSKSFSSYELQYIIVGLVFVVLCAHFCGMSPMPLWWSSNSFVSRKPPLHIQGCLQYLQAFKFSFWFRANTWEDFQRFQGSHILSQFFHKSDFIAIHRGQWVRLRE